MNPDNIFKQEELEVVPPNTPTPKAKTSRFKTEEQKEAMKERLKKARESRKLKAQAKKDAKEKEVAVPPTANENPVVTTEIHETEPTPIASNVDSHVIIPPKEKKISKEKNNDDMCNSQDSDLKLLVRTLLAKEKKQERDAEIKKEARVMFLENLMLNQGGYNFQNNGKTSLPSALQPQQPEIPKQVSVPKPSFPIPKPKEKTEAYKRLNFNQQKVG